MLFVLVPLALLAAAFFYQTISAARDRHVHPPPGRLIQVGNARLHLHEQGQGSPIVVLEAGIGASSLSWALVQPKIAAFARVISYDRAGLGWSAASEVPRSVDGMISELRSLLLQARAELPYVLVGHSFGGLLIRAYAALYPQDVAGLVLVDPVSVKAWADCPQPELRRLLLGVKLSKRGAWAARFGLVRGSLALLVAGRRWFPKHIARLGGRQGTTAMTNLIAEVRKLPPEVWPLVRSHWSDPKCFLAMAAYLHCLPECARRTVEMPVRGRPMVILSAATAKQEELDERDEWIKQSGCGKHIQVPESGHWLHLEHPELVVEAVQEVINMGVRHSTSYGL
ncbi:MAG TPA: alpha/beta hydrolase [Bryobacteraceae bacterium]|nr:alpha/beta hydrolase [Bryobacteraceae bacterium]